MTITIKCRFLNCFKYKRDQQRRSCAD